MKKVKALALFSTAILATASTGVYADELISDGTTSPSTEQVTPSTAPSSEVVIPDEGSTTPSTDTGSTTGPTVPVDPTNPSSDVTEVTDDNGVTTDHTGDSDTQTESNTDPSEAVPNVDDAGGTIVSTQNGSVVLADGTITSPESIGATTNSDGTISVTTATGESTTLPMTGDENTTLLSILGSALAAIGGLFFKKRQYFN